MTALEAMAPHGLGPARLPLVHVRRVTDAAGRPTGSMRSENFLIYWHLRNGSFPERLVVESSQVGEGSQAVLLRFHRTSGCFLSQRLTGLQSFLGPDPTFRWKGLGLSRCSVYSPTGDFLSAGGTGISQELLVTSQRCRKRLGSEGLYSLAVFKAIFLKSEHAWAAGGVLEL